MSNRKAVFKALERLMRPSDTWSVTTGSAGFVKLYKNGQRVQPKHFSQKFRA